MQVAEKKRDATVASPRLIAQLARQHEFTAQIRTLGNLPAVFFGEGEVLDRCYLQGTLTIESDGTCAVTTDNGRTFRFARTIAIDRAAMSQETSPVYRGQTDAAQRIVVRKLVQLKGYLGRYDIQTQNVFVYLGEFPAEAGSTIPVGIFFRERAPVTEPQPIVRPRYAAPPPIPIPA